MDDRTALPSTRNVPTTVQATSVTTTTKAPRVTIGIPVYNGESYLQAAVESLLRQTFSDFEVLIADNASTDATATICRHLAAQDARIRVIRHSTNIGAPRNWNSLVHAARGEFFKWASCNDVCDERMLESCVAVLDADPSQVLVYGRTQLMTEEGESIGLFDGDIDVQMPRPSDRFAAVCRSIRLNNPQSGLMRTAVLRRTSLDRLYPSGDLVLTAEIALHGRIRLLPDVMLYRRQGINTFTSAKSPLQIQRLYDPGANRPLHFRRGRRHLDNLRCIWRAPMCVAERLRASAFALRMLSYDRVNVLREVGSALRVVDRA